MLHRNTNGESFNDLVSETTDTTESEVEIKNKSCWPRQKGESGNKEWEDKEIFALIYLAVIIRVKYFGKLI